MDRRSVLQDKRDAGAWQAGCRVEGLLVCIALGIGVAALLAVAPGAPGSRWERFGLFGFFALWIVLPWFLVVCAILRPWQTRARVKATAALVLLLGWTLAVGAVTHALMHPLGIVEASRSDYLQDIAMIGAILTGSLGLVSWQASRLRHWRTRSSTAEVEAWTARLRPHFLFNSLNGITELVATDPQRAERMIEALSRILRACLDTGSSVPLAQELAVVQDYLALESMRLEERLSVSWDLPPCLPQISVPSLCLQTLAENAVRHGATQVSGGGEVQISIREHDGQVISTISNNTASAGRAGAIEIRDGMGLASTRARLAELFGTAASLETTHTDGRFIARLSLPTTDKG
ncbi:MAG: histidine kinase [Azoarcus sp.]|nr:histidine kinase [Azoarcus sp.]